MRITVSVVKTQYDCCVIVDAFEWQALNAYVNLKQSLVGFRWPLSQLIHSVVALSIPLNSTLARPNRITIEKQSDFLGVGVIVLDEQGSTTQFRRRFVILISLLFAFFFIYVIKDFIEPLVLAAIFSGIVFPLFKWLKGALNGRTNLASALTVMLSILLMVVPVTVLLGIIAGQALEVANAIKPWLKDLNDQRSNGAWLPDWVPLSEQLLPYREQILSKVGEFAQNLGVQLAGILAKVSQGTVIFFLNLFIMLYAMFFFLVYGPSWIANFMGFLPLSNSDREKIVDVGLMVSKATIKGTLVIGLIQGTLGGIAFAVVGLNAAVFWGAVMAILSILPGIGSALVWIPAVVYMYMQGHIVEAIGLLAWCAVVVGSVDNILRPTLVGRDTQLPDLLILVSTLGGLSLFGASGLIFGPMLVALCITVLAIYERVFSASLTQTDQVQAGDANTASDP